MSEQHEAGPYGKVASPRDLGRAIRAGRKRQGVAQAEAAALAGVGERFLSEVERGKATAEIGRVMQVLDRVGLELWVFPRGARVTVEGAAGRELGP